MSVHTRPAVNLDYRAGMTVTGSDAALEGSRADPAARGPGAAVAWAIRAIALFPIVVTGIVMARRIGYPYELQWLEGGSVELARRVSAGQPLYAAPTLDFTAWPYPPLYHWVSAALGQLTGQGFLPLRLVSLVSWVGALMLVALIVARSVATVGRYTSGHQRVSSVAVTAGLVASGTLAASYSISGLWADIARVDSLFLALTLAGIAVAQRARAVPAGFAVGVVFLAAVLTKQNALIVAVFVIAWLLLARRRVGVTAVATLLSGLLISTLIGNAVTDGWYGFFVGGLLVGHGVVLPWLWLYPLADVALPFAPVWVAGILWWWRRGRELAWAGQPVGTMLRSPTGLIAAAVVGLLLAGWVGRLHSGGFDNVLMPTHAGLAIVIGLGVARVLMADPSNRTGLAVAGVLAVQFAVVLALLIGSVPTAADRAAGDQFIRDVAARPGRVIVYDHPYYATLAGKPSAAQGLAVADVLRGTTGAARDGLLASIDARLADPQVSTVIFDNGLEAEPFSAALARDFRLLATPAVAGDAFFPVTDLPQRPTLVYVRKDPA